MPVGSCPGPAFRQEDETGRVSVLPGSSDSALLRVRGPDQVRCLRGCAHCSAVVRPPIGWWSKVPRMPRSERRSWAPPSPSPSPGRSPPGSPSNKGLPGASASPVKHQPSGHQESPQPAVTAQGFGNVLCGLFQSGQRQTRPRQRWDGPNRSGHRACAPARVGVRACVTVCARVCESRH